MRKFGYGRAIVTAIAVWGFLTPAWSVRLPAEAQSGDSALTTIHVNAMMVDDTATIMYAQKSGLFRQAGLDVILTPATSGAAVVPAVLGGSYEIGTSSFISVMNAHLHDLPVVVVAPGWLFESDVRTAELIVAADSKAATGKDFNGTTIGVPSIQELNRLAASAWIDSHGGDSKSVKYIELPLPASVGALQDHRIAATILLEPFLSAALRTGAVRSLGSAYAAVAPHFEVSVWFARKDWSVQHPDIVARFVRALTAAKVYANAHHDATAPLMAEATGIPLAVVQNMVRTTSATTLRAADLQPIVKVAAKYGIISHEFPAAEVLFADPSAH